MNGIGGTRVTDISEKQMHACFYWSVFPLRCASVQLRGTSKPFAQWNLILAHLQHSKFHILYMYISHRPITAWNASLVVSTWLHSCISTKIKICSR